MCKSKALGGRCNGYLNKRITVVKKKLDDRVSLMISSGVLSDKIALEQEVNEHWKVSKDAKAAGNLALAKVAAEQAKALAGPLKEARSKLNLFKDETAHLAAKYDELQTERERRDGTYLEYDGEELGTAKKTTTYPSNTKEWHEQRALAIGGSDVGAIMGVSDFGNRAKIFKDKTEIDYQAKADQKSFKGGALYRGDSWENNIVRMAQEKNPQWKVIRTKSSWVHKEREYQQANVDGLICEDGSDTPTAILEIKTSSVAAHWEHGPPAGYRLQTLHYMDTFGMKKAHLAVLIDDHDYRQYEITPEPGELENIRSEVAKFQDEVTARRAEIKAEREAAKKAAVAA